MSFAEPEQTGGLRLYPKDILGHLLLIYTIEYISDSPTQFSRPDKPSDVIICDVVDLDQIDEDGRPGLVARKCWWRQAMLIQSLRPLLGTKDPILARMSKGGATQGRNAPFVLTSMTQDQQCVNKATAWINASGFVPSDPSPAKEEYYQPDFRSQGTPTQDHWAQPEGLPPTSPPPRQETMLERMARQAAQPRPSEVPSPQGQYQYPDDDNPGF